MDDAAVQKTEQGPLFVAWTSGMQLDAVRTRRALGAIAEAAWNRRKGRDELATPSVAALLAASAWFARAWSAECRKTR